MPEIFADHIRFRDQPFNTKGGWFLRKKNELFTKLEQKMVCSIKCGHFFFIHVSEKNKLLTASRSFQICRKLPKKEEKILYIHYKSEIATAIRSL